MKSEQQGIERLRRGKPDALLYHSDQDSQYTSEQFKRLMADNGVTC
jgi:putative transposase